MKISVITGMSGSGKTQVMRFFEDMGYFCIDNMPPILIPKLLELFASVNNQKNNNIALAIDMRVGDMITGLIEQVDILRESGYKCELIFLDADDATLVKRYKETRRSHPVSSSSGLLESIKMERIMLSDMYDAADFVIDTTNCTISALYKKLKSMFGTAGGATNMLINVVAFGFKYGMPLDADLVYDVRCFPNPFYVDELKKKTGNDKEVQDYVMNFESSREFMKKLNDMITFLVPHYIDEGKSTLTIAIGCTGGRHRSVTMANKLADHLKANGYDANVVCRDIERD